MLFSLEEFFPFLRLFVRPEEWKIFLLKLIFSSFSLLLKDAAFFHMVLLRVFLNLNVILGPRWRSVLLLELRLFEDQNFARRMGQALKDNSLYACLFLIGPASPKSLNSV